MSQDTRKDKRAKVVSLNVRYKSATIDEFIDNHSHDVSRGGVFVKTQTPFAPGTLLKFEIRLSGDQAVIAGVGRVVWKREPTQAGSERPAGMGVKFIKVDDSSRVVIEKLTGAKADAGSAYLSEPEGVAEDGPPQVGVTMSTVPKPAAGAPAATGSAPRPGAIGVPKIPGATPPPTSVVPRMPGAAPPPAAAAPPKLGPPAVKLPAPTPAPPVAKAPVPTPADKSPMAGASPRGAPNARKATMMGIAPPTRGGAATPPPPGIEPLGAPIMPAPSSTGPSSPFRPGAKDPPPPSPPAKVELRPIIPRAEPKPEPREMSLPKADPQLHVPTRNAPMFPRLGPESEPEIAHEPTVMKQAAELLEEALSAAGGSLDEIGDNPLFTGTPAPVHGTQPIAPLIPDDELPAATETGTLIMGARGVTAAHLMGEAGDPTGGESAISPSVPPMSGGLAPPIIAPQTPLPQMSPVSAVPQSPSSQSGRQPAFAAPAPEKIRAQVQSTPDAKKKGSGGTIALVLLVLLLLGGGAVGAYKMGYLASVLGGGPSPHPSAQPSMTATTPPPPSASMSADMSMLGADAGATGDASTDAGKASDGAVADAAPAVSAVPVQQPVPQPRPRPRPQPQPQPEPSATETTAPTTTTAPTETTAPTTAPTPTSVPMPMPMDPSPSP